MTVLEKIKKQLDEMDGRNVDVVIYTHPDWQKSPSDILDGVPWKVHPDWQKSPSDILDGVPWKVHPDWQKSPFDILDGVPWKVHPDWSPRKIANAR